MRWSPFSDARRRGHPVRHTDRRLIKRLRLIMSESPQNKFIVRVLRHGVDHESEAYGMLYMEMCEGKFRRAITDADSDEGYHLPPAEYFYQGSVNRRFVLGWASESVRAIGWFVAPKRSGAQTRRSLSRKSAGITFDGLAPVRTDEDV